MGETSAEAQQAECVPGRELSGWGVYGALARVNLTDPAVSLALEGKKFRGVRMRVGLPCGRQCVSDPKVYSSYVGLLLGQHNSFHFEVH